MTECASEHYLKNRGQFPFELDGIAESSLPSDTSCQSWLQMEENPIRFRE